MTVARKHTAKAAETPLLKALERIAEGNCPLWIATCEAGIASMCKLADWADDSESELECHAELQALVNEWCRAVGP